MGDFSFSIESEVDEALEGLQGQLAELNGMTVVETEQAEDAPSGGAPGAGRRYPPATRYKVRRIRRKAQKYLGGMWTQVKAKRRAGVGGIETPEREGSTREIGGHGNATFTRPVSATEAKELRKKLKSHRGWTHHGGARLGVINSLHVKHWSIKRDKKGYLVITITAHVDDFNPENPYFFPEDFTAHEVVAVGIGHLVKWPGGNID